MANCSSRELGQTPVRFPALDGYELGGFFFSPESVTPPTVAVVLACGGGVPAVRYSNFARYLAQEGIPALTYDYRGIGMSRPSSLRGFRATLEDWSEYDCAGAIAFLLSRCPAAALVGIAHSIGAFLLGGAPNVSVLRRLVLIGAHTGYVGDYRRPFRWPMALLWHGVMPSLARAIGYFPGRRLRLGEDIPRDVALQWAQRRRANPRTVQANSRNPSRWEAFFSRCASAKGQALVLGFSDDAFATESGTTRFLAEFPQVHASRIVIAPKDAGVRHIGHFGFFSRKSESTLWPFVVEYVRSGMMHPIEAKALPSVVH